MRPDLVQKGVIPADFEIDEADYRRRIRRLIDTAPSPRLPYRVLRLRRDALRT